MIVYDHTIVRRYAEALFNAGRLAGNLEVLYAQAEALLPSFVPFCRPRVFLEAPQITEEAKRAYLDKALKGVLDPLMYSLLTLLLSKDRIDYAKPVLERFRTLCENSRGVFRAEISTAYSLVGEERQRMQEALERFTGVKLKIDFRVNPDVIAGTRFIFGETLVDDTVQGNLRRLLHHLEGVAVT